MIKCIHISFGYVESSQISGLNFTCKTGFETPEEALGSLANGLYHKYADNLRTPSSTMKKCCKKYSSNKDFEYCPKCSTGLRNKNFDVQDYTDWLRHLPVMTADSFGGGDIVAWRDSETGTIADTWYPWNSLTRLLELDKSQVLDIMECGEAVLLPATTDLKTDYPHQDFEDDFGELGYLPEEYKKLLPAAVEAEDE